MTEPNEPDPTQKGPSPESSSRSREGWIEGLAKRSTGLPGDTDKGPATSPKGEKSPWSYAGLGIQFAGTIALFTYFGFKLDQKMGWSPWGMVSLSMIGVIGSFYLLIKEMMRENRDK